MMEAILRVVLFSIIPWVLVWWGICWLGEKLRDKKKP